jgi:ATP-dependent Clp protease ATP-binding subunit ClpA
MIGYQPLDGNSLAAILDQQLDEFQNHVSARLGVNEFAIDVPESSRQFLLRTGTSAEYGARELKRTLHRQLIQPMAAMVAGGKIAPGCTVRVSYSEETRGLELIPGVENQELPIESENTNSSHFRRRGPRRVRPDQDSLRLSA